MSEQSVVRENLLTRRGYTPYCGGQWCDQGLPRTVFAGEQFVCRCGWRSSFEPEFIERYKAAQAQLRQATAGVRPCPRCDAPPGTPHSSSCPNFADAELVAGQHGGSVAVVPAGVLEDRKCD